MSIPPGQEPSQENHADDASQDQNSKWWKRKPGEAMRVALVSAAISLTSLGFTVHVTLSQTHQQSCDQIISEERKRIEDASLGFVNAAINLRSRIMIETTKRTITTLVLKKVSRPLGAGGVIKDKVLGITITTPPTEEEKAFIIDTTEAIYAKSPEYAKYLTASTRIETLGDPGLEVAANTVSKTVKPAIEYEIVKIWPMDHNFNYMEVHPRSSDNRSEFEGAIHAFSKMARKVTYRPNRSQLCN